MPTRFVSGKNSSGDIIKSIEKVTFFSKENNKKSRRKYNYKQKYRTKKKDYQSRVIRHNVYTLCVWYGEL